MGKLDKKARRDCRSSLGDALRPAWMRTPEDFLARSPAEKVETLSPLLLVPVVLAVMVVRVCCSWLLPPSETSLLLLVWRLMSMGSMLRGRCR